MKNKRKIKFIKTLLLAVIIVCLVQIGRSYYLSMQHKAQQNTLKEMMETPSKYTTENTNDTPKAFLSILADQNAQDLDSNKEQTENEPVILSKYSDLYKENSDLIGWLSIDGMEIDYPVMQCEDDEYYLHHDFYGNDSKYGCLYVRKEADINAGSNFIIYGHNMKDGSMFGDLDFYLKESFYLEHPVISFDTLYEERTYEIIAVFQSQVYNEDEDTFKYYRFYEAATEKEFDDFYRNIKELSLYDTGITAEFGDTFLTLSTCAYHVTDGRLVVVAKRI